MRSALTASQCHACIWACRRADGSGITILSIPKHAVHLHSVGVLPGDMIGSMNGRVTQNAMDLRNAILQVNMDKAVSVKIYAGGTLPSKG